MIVVADTSPLNYLIRLGHPEVLREIYGRVLVPHAVLENLQPVEWRVKTESRIGLPLLQVRLPAQRKSVKGAQRTIAYKNASPFFLWKISY
jgi:predicted nucleic acid-binding protein